MELKEITTRLHARYLAFVNEYDDKDAMWTERCITFVMAARSAGIVDDLPDAFTEGDLMELPPQYTRELINLGGEIAAHIMAATNPPSEGES